MRKETIIKNNFHSNMLNQYKWGNLAHFKERMIYEARAKLLLFRQLGKVAAVKNEIKIVPQPGKVFVRIMVISVKYAKFEFLIKKLNEEE